MRKVYSALLVSTFTLTSSSWADPVEIARPLKVGAILTLSGSFASAGDDSRRGIEAALAVAENSNLVEVVYADSRSEPSVAITEFQRLVNVEHVAAVYTHRGPIGMALNPISLGKEVPLLGAVGHQRFASSNDFAIQVWPRSDDEGRSVANEFGKRKFERAAVLYTEDDWTSSVTDGFRMHLKELGISLVFDQSVLPGEQDFRTQMARLKATAPDGVYLNVLLPQIAPALRQSRALKVPGELFCNFYVSKKEFLDSAGVAALEGIRYVELDTDLPALKKQLQKDEPPPGLSVASYISTLLLIQAAKEIPAPQNTADINAAILRQREVRTPDSVYPVENRYLKLPLVVKVIANGKSTKEVGAE